AMHALALPGRTGGRVGPAALSVSQRMVRSGDGASCGGSAATTPRARAGRGARRPCLRDGHGAGNMSKRQRFVRAQRMTIVNGILLFVILIVILQLWLLTATMNAYLGGDTNMVLPAALSSLVCLGLNLGLLWYLYRLDG